MLKIIENFENNQKQLRDKQYILSLARKYIKKYGPKQNADQYSAPVSGKVVGEEEVTNLLEASLDLWLTSGRFNKSFEREMSKILNIKYFLTCNSGSSANLLALSSFGVD